MPWPGLQPHRQSSRAFEGLRWPFAKSSLAVLCPEVRACGNALLPLGLQDPGSSQMQESKGTSSLQLTQALS